MQDFARIAWFDRSAVEQAQPCAVFDFFARLGADQRVHVLDVVVGGRFARTDRPDRFIGNGGVFRRRAVGQGLLQLFDDDAVGLAGHALRIRFTDADNGLQPRRMYGGGLSGDIGAGFAVILAALGMAEDDIGTAKVFEHFNGDIARIGAGGFLVTILTAGFDAGMCHHIGHGIERRCRWT